MQLGQNELRGKLDRCERGRTGKDRCDDKGAEGVDRGVVGKDK